MNRVDAIVLDSSAILAAVNGEDGGEIVRPRLSGAMVSAVNVAELYTKLHEYSRDAFETERAVLEFVGIIPFDAEQARLTGDLRPATKIRVCRWATGHVSRSACNWVRKFTPPEPSGAKLNFPARSA